MKFYKKKFFMVSICIPVYNGEKTIYKTIKSILAQNFENLEILISNNASTDRTLEIINQLRKKDSRIKIFNQAQKIPALRNFKFLLNKTKGDYIMWLAAHHRISKNFIFENSNFLEKNKDYIASMGLDYFEFENDKKRKKQNFTFNHDIFSDFKSFFKNCWRTHGLFYSIIRRSTIFTASKCLKPYYASDWSFMTKLVSLGKINRIENSFLILGTEGKSTSKNAHEYVKDKYKTKIPFYYFNKYFFKLVNKNNSITFFQKVELTFISLLLNLRYLISILKK
jgi:glycosyltransferase involved in cell wall biosynthesis